MTFIRPIALLFFISLLVSYSKPSLFAQEDISPLLIEYETADVNRKIDILYYIETRLQRLHKDSLLHYVNDLQMEGYENQREDAVAMANIAMARYLTYNSLYDEALNKLTRTEEYYKSIGNDTMTAFLYNMIGGIYFYKGDMASAEVNFLQSRSYAQKSGVKQYILLAQPNLSRIYSNQGKFEEAKSLVEEYINYYTSKEDMVKLSDAYGTLGSVYLYSEDYEKAKDAFMIGMEWAQSSGNDIDVANGYTNMAIAEYYTNKLEESEKYFRLALAYRKKSASDYYIAEGYYNLGDFYFGIEKYDSAISNYKQTIIIAEIIDNLALNIEGLQQLYEIYKILDQPQNQIMILEKIVEIQALKNDQQATKTVELLNKSNKQSILELESMAAYREKEAYGKLSSYQGLFKDWIWTIIACISASLIIVFYLKKKNKKDS